MREARTGQLTPAMGRALRAKANADFRDRLPMVGLVLAFLGIMGGLMWWNGDAAERDIVVFAFGMTIGTFAGLYLLAWVAYALFVQQAARRGEFTLVSGPFAYRFRPRRGAAELRVGTEVFTFDLDGLTKAGATIDEVPRGTVLFVNAAITLAIWDEAGRCLYHDRSYDPDVDWDFGRDDATARATSVG